MRFTRTPPASRDQLRDQVLHHADAISAGMRIVASRVAAPGRGVMDLLAADERGRLILVTSALQVTPAVLSRSLSQWDWLLHNLDMLRSLAPFEQCDLTLEPRLLLVGAGISAAARRLAGYVNRPEIDLVQITVVQAGDQEGVLVDRLEPVAPPVAEESADPLLGGLPPGEARSVARRLLERVNNLCEPDTDLKPVLLGGVIDVRSKNRTIATLVADAGGLRLRMSPDARETTVTSEEDCEEAARRIAGSAKAPADDRQAGSGTDGPLTGKIAPMAALSEEEIAEFEKLAGKNVPSGEQEAPMPEPGSSPVEFVEN